MEKDKYPTRFKKGNTQGQRFTSENQPKNAGRKGKQITQHLKAIGNASQIEFDIKITDGNGRVTHKKGNLDADKKTMNEVLGSMMWIEAIKGNQKSQREILDRVEGRSQTHLDITSQGDVLTLTPEQRKSKLAALKEKMLGKKSE